MDPKQAAICFNVYRKNQVAKAGQGTTTDLEVYQTIQGEIQVKRAGFDSHLN